MTPSQNPWSFVGFATFFEWFFFKPPALLGIPSSCWRVLLESYYLARIFYLFFMGSLNGSGHSRVSDLFWMGPSQNFQSPFGFQRFLKGPGQIFWPFLCTRYILKRSFSEYQISLWPPTLFEWRFSKPLNSNPICIPDLFLTMLLIVPDLSRIYGLC